jgi:hypothetical protein
MEKHRHVLNFSVEEAPEATTRGAGRDLTQVREGHGKGRHKTLLFSGRAA